jgi:MFS family permease
MKDITIKAKTIKRELWIFLGVFIFTFGLNIYSILHYKTSWSELYTHIHIVALMAIAFYCILSVARILIGILSKLFGKKTTT